MMKIYEVAPADFNMHIHVAACYVQVGDKLLWLLRSAHKLEGEKWCVPGGKVEVDESVEEAALRELFEETGIQIERSQLVSLGPLYVRKPGVDFVFHLFRVEFDALPEVSLSDEHLDYIWATETEMKKLPLIVGGLEAYSLYVERAKKKRR